MHSVLVLCVAACIKFLLLSSSDSIDQLPTGMGDVGNMREEGRMISISETDSWTEVRASNSSLNRQNLGFLAEFDRSLVSVGRQIGEGGQGRIYEAKLYLPFSFNPVPVVVKKFKPLIGVSQGHFPAEMLSAKCYFISRPLGVFFEGESLCLIMKRFSCDLRAEIDSCLQDLRDGNPSYDGSCFLERHCTDILLQLAMGLNALHECGVYHGDLKAANILVMRFSERSNVLMRYELGIADFERSDDVVGTGFYRAPEVFQSLITRIPLSKDQWLAADIYSFGMVCYEVLTGEVPFKGHRLSDHGLVLNGRRPELPDHVPESLQDMIRRCWRVDPSSRPSWTDIIQVLKSLDHRMGTYTAAATNVIDKIVILESSEGTSFDSIILKLKQLVQERLMDLHDTDATNFVSCLYWASEFISTAEEYVSKFEVESLPGNPLLCKVLEFMERQKFSDLLALQVLGFTFSNLARIHEVAENVFEFAPESFTQRGEIQSLMVHFSLKVFTGHSRVLCASEFDDEVSWTGKLLFFHDVVKWHLLVTTADKRIVKSMTQQFLLSVSRSSGLHNVFFPVCMIVIILVDTYIYALAMFSYEPIMLCLQYGLYKIKGRNNMYRSSGYRICRLQRVWMNCTGDKLVNIGLISSLVALCASLGWIGVLGWIWIPCLLIIFSPAWRQSLF